MYGFFGEKQFPGEFIRDLSVCLQSFHEPVTTLDAIFSHRSQARFISLLPLSSHTSLLTLMAAILRTTETTGLREKQHP